MELEPKTCLLCDGPCDDKIQVPIMGAVAEFEDRYHFFRCRDCGNYSVSEYWKVNIRPGMTSEEKDRLRDAVRAVPNRPDEEAKAHITREGVLRTPR